MLFLDFIYSLLYPPAKPQMQQLPPTQLEICPPDNTLD